MAYLFAYADIVPLPLPKYQRWMVAITEAAVLAGNPRKQRWEAEAIFPHLE